MSKHKGTSLVIAVALGMLLCAMPAGATSVFKGLDLLQTQNGAYVDFSDNPLPQNFFGCSETFAGTIPVSGSPIASSPSVSPADTIIDRLDDVPLGAFGTTRVQIAGLCLKNNNWTDPCGNSWQVSVRLDSSGAPQPIGSMTIFHSSPTGGTFNSSFTVNGEVLWTAGAITLGPVADSVALASTGGCWNHTPGAGGIQVTGAPTIDRDCDGSIDTTLSYGTSNFFPGWCPPAGGGGPPTYTPIPEQGPHPVKGAKKRPCTSGEVEPAEPTGIETTQDGVASETETEPQPCDADPVPTTNLPE